MFEIKLCAVCGRVKPLAGKCSGDHSTELADLRSCGECTTYTPIEDLIPKHDGRLICGSCHKRAGKLAQKRSQLNLFGQQSLI